MLELLSYESIHHLLAIFAQYAVVLSEFIGLLVIVSSSITAVYNWIKKNPATKLNLAEGLALGLEFKLGGEILRTVIVRDFSEIQLVGAIIILRAALTFLIHWEIKNEKTHNEKKNS